MDVTFNRKTIISFPDNAELPDIEEGIVEGTLFIDEVLFTDRFTVGTCNSNRFECQLYNFPTIGKEKIYVYQIVDEVEGEEPVEVPLFTGYVDTCVTNRGRFEDSKTITAYDVLYSKSSVDVSAWWEQLFDAVNKVTLKQLRESLLDYVDIDYTSETLPNDNIEISQTQQLNTIKFSSMLTYILQLNGVNANIKRDGSIEFITVSGNTVDITDTYAQNTTEFDTYTVPAYATVRITNTTDNIVATAGADYNYLDITDNLLVMNKSAQELTLIAQHILDNIINITYKPARIDMIYSQLNVNVGDYVSIDGQNYLVCENIFRNNMFVDQQIGSTGENAFAESTADYDASKKEMQDRIQASSLKYYRHHNDRAISVGNSSRTPIASLRYVCSNDGVVIYHGCAIIDVNVIDTTEEARVVTQYMVNKELVREYTPTETYFADGRHTLHFLHFWDASSGVIDYFRIYLTCTNCTVNIGAFREQGYLEGMGLIGETVWDGVIDAEATIGLIPITGELNVRPFTDAVTDTVQVPLSATARAKLTKLPLDSVGVKPFVEVVAVGKDLVVNHTWTEIAEYTWAELEDGFIWG